MSGERVYITTPVGRFVMGDAFEGSNEDMNGRPRLDQKGQPKTQWFMGVAIPKTDPEFPGMWAQITAVGQRDFPAGEWQKPDFAWKIVDGDAKYPDRPECKGCYVVRFSSGFAPTVYNAQNVQIVDKTQCKRGDYVRIYMSVSGNDDRTKPGVYINHHMVQVCGFGEEIKSGPSAAEVFGAKAFTLPPGASATPVAPAAGMPALPSGMPGAAVAPGLPTMGIPAAMPGIPTASPANGVAPYPQILNGPTR